MNKLFNKKTMIVYVIMLSVCFIMGCVMAGMNVHYTTAFEEATKSDDLTQKVVDVISGLASALTSNANGTTTSSSGDEEVEYDEATQAILTKKNTTQALMIVFFILTAVFIAGSIAANEYPKYLESEKYSAKLKRQKKAEKILEQQASK